MFRVLAYADAEPTPVKSLPAGLPVRSGYSHLSPKPWYLEKAPSIVIGRLARCVDNPSMLPSLFDHMGTEFPFPPTVQQVLGGEMLMPIIFH